MRKFIEAPAVLRAKNPVSRARGYRKSGALRTPLGTREVGSRAAEVQEGEDAAVLLANAEPALPFGSLASPTP